ncbi:MAG: hypothetical protein IPI49_13010 [Myxococcales bacterium]|nr:hypothetical protein [Myxococcales bacterium]
MRTSVLLTLLFTLSAALMAPPLMAEPVVLAVEGGEIYVDLGARDGVGAGSELELLHEVVVRDPRTGAVLRDRFALGTLVIHKSGERISVARGSEELTRRVLVGDRVRLTSAPRRFSDPWQAKLTPRPATPPAGATPPASAPTAGAPAAAVDHIALAGAAWEATLGKPAQERIARWEKLLQADPGTPYRKAIEAEMESLRRQAAQREAALARARSQSDDGRAPRLSQLARELLTGSSSAQGAVLTAAPLPRAVPGKALELAFLIADPGRVVQAWLFVRPAGDPGFRRLPLVRDGDVYLRGRVDAELVRTPKLEWYVEAELTTLAEPAGIALSETAPVIGTQDAPRVTTIDAVVTEPPIDKGRSHIDAHVDYVDFDGQLSKGFDQYYLAEIDFTYRFLEPVYAMRLGFGTMSGTGGPKDVIDEDPLQRCLQDGRYQCSRVTFSYVYTELEFRLRPQVALLLRPQAGLLTTDRAMDADSDRCQGSVDLEGCGFHTRFGGRVRLRFGSETGTNLAIGAGFTDGVGTLLEAAYQWLPTMALPVQLVVQVTDMPVPENLGVRLIADVGWRRVPWFYPSLRVSYQARDIDHAGFSGGLALNFDW